MNKSLHKLILLSIIIQLFSCSKVKNSYRDYQYFIPVEVNAKEITYNNEIVELEIDLQKKLQECYAGAKEVDFSSIIVVELDESGTPKRKCVSQYDINTLLWQIDGDLSRHSSRFFNIYFNTTDKISENTVSDTLVRMEALPGRWAFTTPNGYFVFDQRGGAFEVFAPQKCANNTAGKDWIREDYKEYNGILNIGDPDTRAIFHPNDDFEADDGLWKGCKSDIIFAGPLHYRIRSINRFGDLPGDYRANTAYSAIFDIYPNYIKTNVTHGNEFGYACIMEMTPGGDSLENTDYIYTGDGLKYMRDENFADDLSTEWFVAGDGEDSTKLFFAHAQNDSVKDGINWYDFMKAVMIGYGRGANPGINTYPNHYLYGFTKASGFDNMEKQMDALLNMPEIVVGKTQRKNTQTWADIQVERNNGQIEVTIENSKFQCKYSTVMTANPETAITSLIEKKTRIDVSGKHIDEMARGKGDRGLLSEKTSLLSENDSIKKIHLEWDNGASVEEIAVFKNQPFFKIDYQKMYINICDMGNKEVFSDGKYIIYGAEEWAHVRKKQLSNDFFRNDPEPHHILTDDIFPPYPNPILGNWQLPAAENPMNYKGWYILAVYSPSNEVGYGRVVPSSVIDHMKLLNSHGFEQFPYWYNHSNRNPFSEYLFVFSGSEDEAIRLGKQIVDMENKSNAFSYNLKSKSISNSIIEVGYGNDKIVEGNRLSGITSFIYKPTGTNLADALDAYGCDYAKYYNSGHADFEITKQTKEFIEACVMIKSDNCVQVIKKHRIYSAKPIFEIEYSQLDMLWFEDFYTLEGENNRVYAFYGMENEITPEMHVKNREEAENTCHHNFGDCYLKAAGSSLENSIYKGHLIFGFYDKNSKVGLGFVLPANIGLHNGFKLWSMHNYESFPFYGMKKELPLKRWIFAFEGGKDGLIKSGKDIVDKYSD